MSGKAYDRELLAYKVQWEGGVLDTIEYGIRAEDIEPGPLRDAWAKVETAYKTLTPLVMDVNRLLREPTP